MAPPAEMEEKLETVLDFPRVKVKLGAPGDVTWGLGTWDDMDASVRVSTRA